MDSLWAQLVLQLGISGLIVFVAYKIAMKLIDRWTQTESERTKAWSGAEDARTKVIADGFRADTEAHGELTKYMHALVGVLSRVEGKIDAAFDLTPVKGVRDYAFREEPPRRESQQGEIRSKETRDVESKEAVPSTYSIKRPKTTPG